MLLFFCAFLVVTVVAGRQFPGNERYIILLDKGSDAGDIEELIQSMEVHASSTREEMQVRSLTSLLPFVFGNMSEVTAKMVSKLPYVELIEKDQIMDLFLEDYVYSPKIDSSGFHRYNLDILDNLNCTDDYFTPFNYGLGADIYVIDSGINYDHIDFRWKNGTSGTRAKLGFDAVDDQYGTNEQGRDTMTPGTHFAGIAGGVDSGIAKDANLYSVRIYDSLHRTIELVLSGMDAVSRLHAINSARSDFVGSIASLTLTLSPSNPSVFEAGAMELISKGIVVVVSSASKNWDVCKTSYCRSAVICVGVHVYDECTCEKKMAKKSGYGECIDFLAPGEAILSANHESNNSFTFISANQVASSHVAGVAALMKAANPALSHYDILIKLSCGAVKDIEKSHLKRIYVNPELIA